MIKHLFTPCLLAVIICALAGRAQAEFYLRPTGHLVGMTDNYFNAELGVGGGLALGAAVGKLRHYEVGAEITTSRSRGDFVEPVHGGSSAPATVATRPLKGSVRLENFLATFRYCFGDEEKSFRPYAGMALGVSLVTLSKESAPMSYPHGQGTCWTAGLGGGFTRKLWKRARLDIGYRYLLSGAVSDVILTGSYGENKFRPTAHYLIISLDQRF